MSIEKLLADLIAALEANTAALEGAAGSSKTSSSSSSKGKTETASGKGKTSSKGKSEGVSQDDMNAALLKLKDDYGIEHAKKVMKKHGFAKMAEITEDKYAVVLKDATKAYEALAESEGEEEEEEDGNGI